MLTLFFNNLNYGDYLVFNVEKSDLNVTDMVLPQKLCIELEKYINSNTKKILNKNNFEQNSFNECDQVELIVEKEKYSKYGIHKGDKGIIALNRASNNKILVDFSNATENFDGFISVDFSDIKKVL